MLRWRIGLISSLMENTFSSGVDYQIRLEMFEESIDKVHTFKMTENNTCQAENQHDKQKKRLHYDFNLLNQLWIASLF